MQLRREGGRDANKETDEWENGTRSLDRDRLSNAYLRSEPALYHWT